MDALHLSAFSILGVLRLSANFSYEFFKDHFYNNFLKVL
jgi:hypothetical protein